MTEIRPLSAADAETCRATFERVLILEFPEFPPEARKAYIDDWSSDHFAQRIGDRKRVMLGAFEGEAVVGFLLGAPPEAGLGTILWLWVAAEKRSQGLGQELVGRVCDAYRDLGCHKVRVFSSDKRNHDFYQRCGMEHEGFHLSHWWGVDFWSLGKIL